MYPCRDAWDQSSMWTYVAYQIGLHFDRKSNCAPEASSSYQRAGVNLPYASSIPCLRYGVNGQENVANASVLETYRKRASYDFLSDLEKDYALQNYSGSRQSNQVSWEQKLKIYGSQASMQACVENPSMCDRSIGLRKGMCVCIYIYACSPLLSHWITLLQN